MNEIRDIHDPLCRWLDKNRIPFHRNRPDKKTTAKKGDPDFLCTLANRCIYVECKVPGGKLSQDQEKRIAYLRQAGNVVRIVYSCEEAIAAISEHFGVENPHSEALGPFTDHDWPGMKEAVRNAGVTAPKEPQPKKQPELPVNGNGASKFRIAMWGNKEWVMAPDMKGNWDRIREASAADVINFPRYGVDTGLRGGRIET